MKCEAHTRAKIQQSQPASQPGSQSSHTTHSTHAHMHPWGNFWLVSQFRFGWWFVLPTMPPPPSPSLRNFFAQSELCKSPCMHYTHTDTSKSIGNLLTPPNRKMSNRRAMKMWNRSYRWRTIYQFFSVLHFAFCFIREEKLSEKKEKQFESEQASEKQIIQFNLTETNDELLFGRKILMKCWMRQYWNDVLDESRETKDATLEMWLNETRKC